MLPLLYMRTKGDALTVHYCRVKANPRIICADSAECRLAVLFEGWGLLFDTLHSVGDAFFIISFPELCLIDTESNADPKYCPGIKNQIQKAFRLQS